MSQCQEPAFLTPLSPASAPWHTPRYRMTAHCHNLNDSASAPRGRTAPPENTSHNSSPFSQQKSSPWPIKQHIWPLSRAGTRQTRSSVGTACPSSCTRPSRTTSSSATSTCWKSSPWVSSRGQECPCVLWKDGLCQKVEGKHLTGTEEEEE